MEFYSYPHSPYPRSPCPRSPYPHSLYRNNTYLYFIYEKTFSCSLLYGASTKVNMEHNLHDFIP